MEAYVDRFFFPLRLSCRTMAGRGGNRKGSTRMEQLRRRNITPQRRSIQAGTSEHAADLRYVRKRNQETITAVQYTTVQYSM